MRHILVVDDEARIREVVQYALSREGFQVTCVDNGRDAIERGGQGDLDLVILDIMLPDIDGLSVCRELRKPRSDGASRGNLPVLFLSARSDEVDRVVGLEIGGDDYLTKPFSPRELVARVRAILRRTDASADTDELAAATPRSDERVLERGPVRIELDRHEARCQGVPVALTATELGVLAALYERPGIVLSRAQLMQRAYPHDNHITDRTIDTHVRRIRAKYRAVSRDVDPIATVHGVGYKAAYVDVG